MNIQEDVLSECRDLLAKGESIDAILEWLRNKDYSKVHSMKALVDLGCCTLGEAKSIVHESSVWTDVRERDEAFSRQVEAHAAEDAKES